MSASGYTPVKDTKEFTKFKSKSSIIENDEMSNNYVNLVVKNIAGEAHQSAKKFKKEATQHSNQQLPIVNNFISRVKVNKIVYFINTGKLMMLEPDNILLNRNENMFNTQINLFDDSLEYIDNIKYFHIIMDYIKGYNIINTIQLLFKNIYLETINTNPQGGVGVRINKLIENVIIELIATCSTLKMFNLVKKINEAFHTITIDKETFIIDIHKTCENENLAIFVNSEIIDNKKYIFRDLNIFQNYLYRYINGFESLELTISNIKSQENDKLFYNKIISDIEFYNLKDLYNYLMGISTNK
jgi:hypothetical protein